MPRGAPDYLQIATQTSRVDNMSINSNVFDTGFARLDGGGRVVYFDDFREGINKYETGVSGGASVAKLSTTQGVGLGYTMPVIIDPVVSGGTSYMRYYFDTPLSGKMGIEFSFYVYGTSGDFLLQYGVYQIDGATKRASFRLSPSSKTAVITNDGGDITIKSYASSNYFSGRNIIVKLVINPSLEQYDAIFMGGERISLQYPLQSDATQKGAGTNRLYCHVNSPSGAYEREAYLNYVIITADEP